MIFHIQVCTEVYSLFESYEVSRGSEVEVEGAKCLGELGETDSGVSNVEAIRSEIDEKSAQPSRIDVNDCNSRRVDTAHEAEWSQRIKSQLVR